MKITVRKNTLALALIVPLLAVIGLALRKAPAASSATAIAAPSTTAAAPVVQTNATSAAAVRQLKQQGSYDSLQAAFQAAQRRAEPVRNAPADVTNAAYSLSAAGRGVRAYFNADAVQVRPAQSGGNAWHWDARLVGYGYGEARQAVERTDPVAQNNSVEYRRGVLTEWYLNDERGLEQAFTLASRPTSPDTSHADSGSLTLTVAINSDLTPKLNPSADSVSFVGKPGEATLNYAGLLAWDANGRSLPAKIELRSGGELALLVDDRAAAYPVTIDPLIYVETKLTAADGVADDNFGTSVAIDGDTVAVGGTKAALIGAVYVFVRSGTTWSLQQEIFGDTLSFADYNSSVSISGDTLVVGAPSESAGTAYIFVRNGTVWTRQAKFAGDPLPNAAFGRSVSISGDTVVVGEPGDGFGLGVEIGGLNLGSAYVYVRSGSSWTLQQKLIAGSPELDSQFGYAVAIDNDTVVIGAPQGSAINSGVLEQRAGAVYVFTRDAGGTWAQQGERLTDPKGIADDNLGRSIAVKGDTLVAGQPGQDSASVSIFVRTLGLQWTLQQKISGSRLAEFGSSVAVDGDTVVVGAVWGLGGTAYVFGRSGNVWAQQRAIVASDALQNDGFGYSVGLSGDTIVVGAPFDETTPGFDAGSAYIYDNATLADLLISQTAAKISSKAGDLITYTITVHNFGPNRAVNVAVDDTIPSGTAFSSAHANKGHFTTPPAGQTGVVSWYVGDMLNGGQEDAQLTVTVLVKGKTALVTNTATVRSDTSDPNPANNISTLATSVGTSGGGKK